MLSRAYKKVVDQGISCTYSNECENMVWDGGEREIAKYIEQDGMRGVRIQWEKSYGMRILTKENRNQSKTLWVSKVICYRNLRQLCLYWSIQDSCPSPHIMQKTTPTSSNCTSIPKYKLPTGLNMTLLSLVMSYYSTIFSNVNNCLQLSLLLISTADVLYIL